jgi:hypothetical protein
MPDSLPNDKPTARTGFAPDPAEQRRRVAAILDAIDGASDDFRLMIGGEDAIFAACAYAIAGAGFFSRCYDAETAKPSAAATSAFVADIASRLRAVLRSMQEEAASRQAADDDDIDF